MLGSAAEWPLAARAQQPALSVIGFLHGALAGHNRAGRETVAVNLPRTFFLCTARIGRICFGSVSNYQAPNVSAKHIREGLAYRLGPCQTPVALVLGSW